MKISWFIWPLARLIAYNSGHDNIYLFTGNLYPSLRGLAGVNSIIQRGGLHY